MSEEWGPWIEHDGGPRPVPRGTFCHAVFATGSHLIGPVGVGYNGEGVTPDGKPWGWPSRIIRYRVRKPRALLDLIKRARELDDAPQGHVRVPGKEVVG